MYIIDRRGVTIRVGDQVRLVGAAAAATHVVCGCLSTGVYARGDVRVGFPSDVEVVARWYPAGEGASHAPFAIRPGDEVRVYGDSATYVVLDVDDGGAPPFPGAVPTVPIGVGADIVAERKFIVWLRLAGLVPPLGGSSAPPSPIVMPCVDRYGNACAEGDTVELANGARWTIDSLDGGARSAVAGGVLLAARAHAYRDVAGRPFGIGAIVWAGGRTYRVAPAGAGRPSAERYPVFPEDVGRTLPVVVRDMDAWKEAAAITDAYRLFPSRDEAREEAPGVASAPLASPPAPPPALTDGESRALCALGKLGVAVEWGMFLAVLDHSWRSAFPTAWLSWDVVAVPRMGVLVTLGVEGLRPIDRFLSFDDDRPRTSKRKKGVRAEGPAPSASGVGPIVSFSPFDWTLDLPPHLAQELLPSWSEDGTLWTHHGNGFVIGAPDSTTKRDPAYHRATDLAAEARRTLRGKMADHYVPPAPRAARPRHAIINEFVEDHADEYFRFVGSEAPASIRAEFEDEE